MKEKLTIIVLASLSLFSLLIPLAAPSLALAATAPLKTNVFDPTILAGPLTICVGAPSANAGSNTLPTCSNLCDLVAQVAQVIYFAIAVVIWIITPIMIAVGGIMVMLGGARPEMVGTGKKTITGAVWSLAIVLCAWLIVYTFVGAFGGLSTYIGFFPGGPKTCSVATSAPAPAAAPAQNTPNEDENGNDFTGP